MHIKSNKTLNTWKEKKTILKQNASRKTNKSQEHNDVQCRMIQTFLFVQRGQNAVVPAHFEVDLLLHTIWDCSLWDNDADSCLYGAQHPAVTIKDAPCRGHHRVTFIFFVVIQCTRARRQRTVSCLFNINADVPDCFHHLTWREWPWEWRWCCCADTWACCPWCAWTCRPRCRCPAAGVRFEVSGCCSR